MTELAGVLTSRLQALWGTAVEVTAVRPLPGGASRESWDVRVHTAAPRHRPQTPPHPAPRRGRPGRGSRPGT